MANIAASTRFMPGRNVGLQPVSVASRCIVRRPPIIASPSLNALKISPRALREDNPKRHITEKNDRK